jgi:hypothetical protein
MARAGKKYYLLVEQRALFGVILMERENWLIQRGEGSVGCRRGAPKGDIEQ